MRIQYNRTQNIQQMSSKPHKIFGPHSSRVGGLEPVTGRNAQFPTMTRKQQYGQMSASQRPSISPFSGYTSSSQNNLAVSQAFEFNPDLTRKIVRQQIERQTKEEPLRNDVSILKTQVRSIKQFLDSFKGKMQKQNEDERESIQNQVKVQMAQVLEDHRIQTAKNLKEVIKKFDENIRKQIFVQFGSKFLPISFVDDMDKQFNELEDRIQIVQNKLIGHNRPSEDPVIIAETIQLRLKKVEREAEYLKKTISETQGLFSNLQTQVMQIKNKQQTQNEKITTLQEDTQKMKNNIDKQTKKIFHTIQENNKLINSIWDDKLKGISEQLNKKISSSSSNQVREFLNNSNNLTVSAMLDKNPSSESAEKEYSSIAKPLFHSPTKETSPKKNINSPDKKESQMIVNNGNECATKHQSEQKERQKQENEKEPQKMVYLIDRDNFLMDSDGNYITNGDGNQIKLSDEQIDIIRKSNILKMIQE